MIKTPFKSLWWAINLQLKHSKAFLAWTIFYSAFNGLSSIASVYAGAKFLASVTAVVFQKGAPAQAYYWLALITGIQIVATIINTLNRLFERRFQQKMELRINQVLINKMYELSQEQFDDQDFNTKLAHARESLFSTWRVMPDISMLVSAVVRFVSAIAVILVVAPFVGTLIAIMVIVVGMVRAWQNRLDETIFKKVEPYDRVAYRTRWMLIDPNVMPEVRLMNAFKHMLSSWSDNLTKSQDIHFRHEKKMAPIEVTSQIIDPLMSLGATLYFLQLLVTGAIRFDRFIFLRGLIDQANSSASLIATSFQRLHQAAVEMTSFTEIYDLAPALPNGTVVVTTPLTIEFNRVSFSYPGSNKPALDDLSFIIAPGSRLALVGENGAGKTTLIKLLMRQYLPSSGEITINGTPIQDVEQNSYYRAISTLSQDFLMVNHLTIRDNLLMGLDHHMTDSEIYTVASMVEADSFIKKLEYGLDQRLDPSFKDGTGLSGGQRQRLGVARALLRNGDLMILDEPTSAIDAKAEFSIFTNIYKAHADKTTLIVSHRFSTVRKAEKIIVMEQGKIIEYGSHAELLKHGGLYKEMFETQAEGYK